VRRCKVTLEEILHVPGMDFNLLSSNVLLEKDSKSVRTYHRDEYLPRWLDRGERFPTLKSYYCFKYTNKSELSPRESCK